jgi:hypothetical protein
VDVLAASRQTRVITVPDRTQLGYRGIAGGVAVLSHPSRADGIACDQVIA